MDEGEAGTATVGTPAWAQDGKNDNPEILKFRKKTCLCFFAVV